jgi:7,8-dihydro-6-hydroxymethylpterin-pyrophosphokinase
MKKRFFVLIPAAEIAPDWNCPETGDSLHRLLDSLKSSRPAEFRSVKINGKL